MFRIYKAAQKGALPPLPTSDEASDMYEASIKVSLTWAWFQQLDDEEHFNYG